MIKVANNAVIFTYGSRPKPLLENISSIVRYWQLIRHLEILIIYFLQFLGTKEVDIEDINGNKLQNYLFALSVSH